MEHTSAPHVTERTAPPLARPDGHADLADALKAAAELRYAMAVTAAPLMRSRPLTTLDVQGDGCVWFFIAADSEVAQDVARQPQMLLVYADTDASRYYSVNGEASVLHDPARARQLWTPMAKAFFSGPDDAALRLLRVDVSAVEWWEPKGTRLGQFMKLAAAAMGAEVKPGELGHHDTVLRGDPGRG